MVDPRVPHIRRGGSKPLPQRRTSLLVHRLRLLPSKGSLQQSQQRGEGQWDRQEGFFRQDSGAEGDKGKENAGDISEE